MCHWDFASMKSASMKSILEFTPKKIGKKKKPQQTGKQDAKSFEWQGGALV